MQNGGIFMSTSSSVAAVLYVCTKPASVGPQRHVCCIVVSQCRFLQGLCVTYLLSAPQTMANTLSHINARDDIGRVICFIAPFDFILMGASASPSLISSDVCLWRCSRKHCSLHRSLQISCYHT